LSLSAGGRSQFLAAKIEDGTVALLEVSGSRVPALTDNPQLQQLRTQRELSRYSQRDAQAYLEEVVRAAKVSTNLAAFQ
jgi:hypothetical protein